jgi:hypothetical protein
MFMGDVVDIGAPSADTVSTAKIQDDAVTAAKLANSINTEITANTAKVTNATHTGDVTGATALTIATDAVDIAMLSATGTASSSTFLRGDNAWAEAAGGKVLQVVSTTKSDTFTTTSDMVDITGLTVDITPSATTSKILVLSTINGSQEVGITRSGITLVRDSTAIFIGDTASSRRRASGAVGAPAATVMGTSSSSCFLDSPSTTSAVTYKWQCGMIGGNPGDVYINRTDDDSDSADIIRMASTITVMEIGA